MISFLLRRKRPLILLLTLAAGIVLIALWRYDFSVAGWRSLLDFPLSQARRIPFPLYVLLSAVLPFAGVPVTALYLAAGAAYSPVYGLGGTLAGMSVGLLLNLLLSYAIARFFREPVIRLLRRFKLPVPSFGTMPAWKVILLVRITPGAPLLIQNLLLGLAGAPLPAYLGISLAAETLITLGYLTAGKSFATGQWGFLFFGVGLIGAALLFASLMRDRGKARAKKEAA